MTWLGPAIAHDNSVGDALANGAHVVFSLSGGKDSSAAAFAVNAHLDSIGHPKDRRHSIHADLGMIEWRSTPKMVETIAAMLKTDLTVVKRKAGGLIERWKQRWESSLRRYENLETYQLVSPFSSARLRFCTGETKVQPIGSELKRRFAGETIISVVGIRREESRARAKAPVSKPDTRFAAPGNRADTHMLTWHPIVDWSADEVFAFHEANGIPLHEAHARSADRWLADVSPDILASTQLGQIEAAKRDAKRRRELESGLPADLRFTRSWPPRIPTLSEAQTIASVRAELTQRHRLENRWPTAQAVRERFGELHAARAA